MDTLVTAFPWDLIDEGRDCALDRLGGEVGVSGISLWVGVPPIHAVRCCSGGPDIFKSDGGVFFAPKDEMYHGTRLKPVLGHFSKSRCPLRTIQNGCRERGLTLRAVVSAARIGLAARRHEEVACKNAYGQPSASTICLQNPDVGHFLVGLVTDLAVNTGVQSVVLRDWWIGWSEGFDGSLACARELSEVERQLLGICFCESCFQRAEIEGVETIAAHRHAKTLLDRFLASADEPRTTWKSLIAEFPSIAAYCELQRQSLLGLFKKIADGAGCQLLVDAEVPISTMSVFDQRAHSDHLVVPFSSGEMPSETGKSAAGTARHIRFPASSAVSLANDLVSRIVQATSLGIWSIDIESYSMLPESTLTILKQAIRFARRQA